ncbi:flavin reductase family protein [Streptomyces atriruber]|uniref:Flavin reductase family protein n=1 Tax=Streptomyces atriruber TaxID=545121 RepID=A0ABV3BQ84_9ACTN|nr:flavin reductase family protein [Streptomyces sp. KL118A]
MLEKHPFRDILGRFATGVVLLTLQPPRGVPMGMAVNSFTSVSLEPPLISLCVRTGSPTLTALLRSDAFAVSILGEQHEELCRSFSTPGAERFSGREWARTPAGHPVPGDALAWLDCRVSAVHPAGDHELVVAETVDGDAAERNAPLVFHRGRFTKLICESPVGN